MLEELHCKITAELASVAFSVTIKCRLFWRGIDGKRKALRSPEAPAPQAQNFQGQSETLRARETPARQASRPRQEISRSQTAGAKQTGLTIEIRTEIKKGVRFADALFAGAAPPAKGRWVPDA